MVWTSRQPGEAVWKGPEEISGIAGARKRVDFFSVWLVIQEPQKRRIIVWRRRLSYTICVTM